MQLSVGNRQAFRQAVTALVAADKAFYQLMTTSRPPVFIASRA